MDFDTSKTMKFEIPKSQRIANFLVYLSLTFLCVFILTAEYYGWNKGSSKAVFAIGVLILSVSSSIAAFNRLLNIPKLTIEVGPAGILDKRICKHPIPWSEIVNISRLEQSDQFMMMLEVTKDFEETQINSVHHLIMKFYNRRMGGKGRCINPMEFHVGHYTFNKIVRTYAKAYNCPAVR
ncbi:hypothetical protein [Roseibium sp.]|uniref:hypothetical protein n=1 Tax=Roseibium sp. TaxID=1936156 RepID=UPI003B501B44